MSGFGDSGGGGGSGSHFGMGALAAVGALAVTGAYWLWNTPREQKGRMLKRVGKTLGIQSLIDKGREMHYGHLSPEELLVQHPSAFLRQNTIRSQYLQHPERPFGSGFHQPANLDSRFHLLQMENEAEGVQGENIVDAGGRQRTRRGNYVMVQDNELESARRIGIRHVGPAFSGGFLPMLQINRRDPSPEDPTHFTGFDQGALNIGQMGVRPPPVFTTELTGCSIVRMGSHLAHVRPHPESGGASLQEQLGNPPSFGRREYPVEHHNAFTMMRRKPDGRVKLYYQIHGYNEADRGERSHSGSYYLESPARGGPRGR
jgi:hypothetical protein